MCIRAIVRTTYDCMIVKVLRVAPYCPRGHGFEYSGHGEPALLCGCSVSNTTWSEEPLLRSVASLEVVD